MRDEKTMPEPSKEAAIVQAVLYAMRHGCFFPVPEPKPPYRIPDLIRWGAMRALHTAVAEYTRTEAPR